MNKTEDVQLGLFGRIDKLNIDAKSILEYVQQASFETKTLRQGRLKFFGKVFVKSVDVDDIESKLCEAACELYELRDRFKELLDEFYE
jgi:hypothetical protein